MRMNNLDAMQGRPVTQIQIDEAFTLVMENGDGVPFELRIETEFQYHHGGRALLVDPRETESLGAVLALFAQEVTQATLAGDGALEIQFTHSRVFISPHATYPAFTLTGPHLQITCPTEKGSDSF